MEDPTLLDELLTQIRKNLDEEVLTTLSGHYVDSAVTFK